MATDGGNHAHQRTPRGYATIPVPIATVVNHCQPPAHSTVRSKLDVAVAVKVVEGVVDAGGRDGVDDVGGAVVLESAVAKVALREGLPVTQQAQ